MSAVEFGFVAELELGGADHELLALLDRDRDGLALRGRCTLGGREFRLSIAGTGPLKTITGTFEHDGASGLDLGSLAESLSPELGALVPSIELPVRRAVFVLLRRRRPALTALLFGVEFDTEIDLAALPLVGARLAVRQRAGLDAMKIVTSSAALDAATLAAIRGTLADAGFDVPPDVTALPAGPVLSGRLRLADVERTIALPMSRPKSTVAGRSHPGGKSGAEAKGGKGGAGGKERLEVADPPGGADDGADGTTWIDLRRRVGPVNLERIGFRLGEGAITLSIDAGLRLGPLRFGADGLGVGNPLAAIDPTFTLDGLSLAYSSGQVAVSGALLHDARDGSFAGAARIEGPGLSISASGAYRTLDGAPSLFLYALLERPLGGPAFFFVTGLALGFGYNRGLIVPTAENVPRFPFVRDAIAGRGDASPDPLRKLAAFRRALPARRGEMFLAAGIRFDSFKLLDSFVLLIVRTGAETCVDVLGITRLDAPPDAGTPIARAELAIRASLNLDRGSLLVRGVLTDRSYVISPRCRLTGGFGLATWFADQPSGARAGDFVVTLGGYHPDFRVPAHYPTAARVGLRWQVTRQLSIKGGIYMALTPACIMAGGEFSAVYRSGKFRAWFDMDAHFIVAWQPYSYRARVSVGVGASYRVQIDFGFLGTLDKTITASVSAALRLWGPEFGGTARVDLSVTSFDIDFGAPVAPPPPLSWAEFESAFLPAPGRRLSLAVTEGLVREARGVAVVDGARFRMVLDCRVPLLDPSASSVPFGIAPMASDGVHRSDCTLTVRKGGEPFDDLTLEPILKRGPAALWGTTRARAPDAEAMLDGLVMGYRLRPAGALAPTRSDERSIRDFAYDIEPRAAAFALTPPSPATEGERSLDAVARDVTAAATARRRAATLHSLGLDAARLRLDALAADPHRAFVTSPRVVVAADAPA